MKRLRLTVEKYLHTDKYGLEDYTYGQKLNALHMLTKNGLERSNSESIITLPIFHAFSINREVDNLRDNINSQCCLFSYKVDKKEFLEVNGKRIQDILWPSNVARIITTICNMLVRLTFIRLHIFLITSYTNKTSLFNRKFRMVLL